MSKQSQRRGTRPVPPTAGASDADRRGAGSGSATWRSPLVIGGAAVVLILAGAIAAAAIGGGAAGRPTPSGPAGAAASATPIDPGRGSVPSGLASAGPSVATGGKLAEALVATLHADPFVAHVVESVLSSSLTNGRRLTLTAKAVGDVSGRDVSIETTTTGGGPATDRLFVSVGDAAWFRAKGDLGWTASPRSRVAGSIDQLLATVQVIDDPSLLADLGVETLDGRSLHHLTAEGGVPFQLPGGVQGNYATFDVWVTDAGIPVLVKATFVQVQGVNSLTGGVDIRYSKVGGPITIAPPAGAPTVAP